MFGRELIIVNDIFKPCSAELYLQSVGYFIWYKMKKCSKCKVEKELDCFVKDKQKYDGLRSSCKDCSNVYNKKYYKKNKKTKIKKQDPQYLKEYRLKNKERIRERDKEYKLKNKEKVSKYQKEYRHKQKTKDYKTCRKCSELRLKEEFRKDCNTRDGITTICKSCDKLYREKNKDSINNYRIKYRLENREKINKRELDRKNNDPVYKLTSSIRCLIKNTFKRNKNNYTKSKRTEEILGCSIQEFIDHMSSKFTEGMTISNHGKWHIDHIIPISLAKTEEEVIKLNHYTNLQPLWAEDNLRKSNKY
jgi:hypothetical protein